MSRLVVALLAFALPLAASAQVVRGEDKLVYEKRTTLDLGGTELDGTMQKPTLVDVNARGRTKFASHLKLRTNFTQELVASARGL